MANLVLHLRLAGATKGMSTDEFEILGHIVHFLPLEICHYDVYLIAAHVVHPSQDHKFRQHGKNDRHHRQLPILHRAMVIDMCGPRAVEWDQPPGIDGAAKDVLGYELAFIPEQHLLHMRMGTLSFSDALKPVEIRIVPVSAMLKPFVDEHIRRVAIQSLFDELTHRERRRGEY